MSSGVKERLSQYLEFVGDSKSEFGRKIGVSNAYISSMRKSIDPDKIQSIAFNYPNLNIEWLLTGNGDMIKGPSNTEKLADRISEVLGNLEYETIPNAASFFGVTYMELELFTNQLFFPSTPFDFVRFLKEFPEFKLQWILTGEGDKFIGDEQECLRIIKERIFHRNHPEYFPGEPAIEIPKSDNNSNLWEQIHFLSSQLQEKDAQIKQLLDILQKK